MTITKSLSGVLKGRIDYKVFSDGLQKLQIEISSCIRGLSYAITILEDTFISGELIAIVMYLNPVMDFLHLDELLPSSMIPANNFKLGAPSREVKKILTNTVESGV
jgi:hypothetical protein